jgi:hypothetical protein
MQPQILHVKDATGLKKEISARKPIPVWVAGMEELPEQIARHIGTHILKPPDVHVATPAVTVEPPTVTVGAPAVTVDVGSITDAIEKYAKLGLYGLIGLGILQAALIVALIFVR